MFAAELNIIHCTFIKELSHFETNWEIRVIMGFTVSFVYTKFKLKETLKIMSQQKKHNID